MLNLYALYTSQSTSNRSANDLVDFQSFSVDTDSVYISADKLGLFPFAGLHEILENDNYLKDHKAKVESDILSLIGTRIYDGIIVVDYSGFWHPAFDWSEYESGTGRFDEPGFDQNVGCSSEDLFNTSDKDYIEDFYNWFYCNENSEIENLIKSVNVTSETPVEDFMRTEWNAVAKSFFEATLESLRIAMPRAKIGFFGFPDAIYKNAKLTNLGPNVFGYGNSGLGKKLNDDLNWLYSSVDIICPFLPAKRFTVADSKTPQTGIENTKSQNRAYLESNIHEAQRIASRNEKPLIPIIGHFYNIDKKPPYHGQSLNANNKEQQLNAVNNSFAEGVFLFASLDNQSKIDQINKDYSSDSENPILPGMAGQSLFVGDSFGVKGDSQSGQGGSGGSFPDTETPQPAIEIGENNEPPPMGVFRNNVRIYTLWEDDFVSVTGNRNQFISWWEQSDGVDQLINKLNNDYSSGFRRFMLYLPGGSHPSAPFPSPNQWFTMSLTRRNELKNKLASWISDHSDARVGVFAGSKIERNLDRLATHNIDYSNAEKYNILSEPIDSEYFRRNFEEWFDLGIVDLFMAGAFTEGDFNDFEDLAFASYINNIRISGKGLPVNDENGQIGESKISSFPVFETVENYKSIIKNYNNQVSFSSSNTEVGIVFDPTMNFVGSDINDLEDDNIIFYTTEGYQDALIPTPSDGTGGTDDGDSGGIPLIPPDVDIPTGDLSFQLVNEGGSDPINGFGLVRYYPGTALAVGQTDGEEYQDFEVVALANSVDGTFEFGSDLGKYTLVEADILNSSFTSTSFPHWTLEDTFEWVNSGMPSHLSQVVHTNIINMGINLIKTNAFGMSKSPPIQARYIVPCNKDFYDSFNSTIDYEIVQDFGKKDLSIPYPTSVIFVNDRNEVWVGGQGGVLSIDMNSFVVEKVDIDNRRDLFIKDFHAEDDLVYVLDEKGVYTLNLEDMSVVRDAGLGLPQSLFQIVSLFNTNLVVSAEDGIYAKQTTQDEWQRVVETNNPVDVMIAPDAVIAMRKQSDDSGDSTEVYYSTDGFNWQSIGTLGNRVVNDILKHRNKIFLGTNKGIYDDNGNFYASRTSIRLNDVFNDAQDSQSIIANDLAKNSSTVIAGLSDGRYVRIDNTGFAVAHSGLSAIHKIVNTNDGFILFSYDIFKFLSGNTIFGLSTGINTGSVDEIDSEGSFSLSTDNIELNGNDSDFDKIKGKGQVFLI